MRSKKLDEAGCITGTHSLVWPDQTHLAAPILILCCNGLQSQLAYRPHFQGIPPRDDTHKGGRSSFGIGKCRAGLDQKQSFKCS